MAFKGREEIVGKRFLSVKSQTKLKLAKISEWEWRSGVVRAVSSRDSSRSDLSVSFLFYIHTRKNLQWFWNLGKQPNKCLAVQICLIESKQVGRGGFLVGGRDRVIYVFTCEGSFMCRPSLKLYDRMILSGDSW